MKIKKEWFKDNHEQKFFLYSYNCKVDKMVKSVESKPHRKQIKIEEL